jgi:HSP20 family molecular chaperone IbpA
MEEALHMSRASLFNNPLMLGFEDFERTLDRISKMQTEGYPPYNIEQVGDNQLRITLAVAGFSDNDLSIELKDNQLVIRGRQADDKDRVFLHQGIAARQFLRNFVLANGIKVKGAHLDNGLLHIELSRPAPESRVNIIKISNAPPLDQRLKIDEATQGGE